MRLELTGRRLKITPALRQLVGARIEKIDRLLHDRALSLQVVLEEEKYRFHVEMTLHARGDHFLHGAGAGRDWEMALGKAVSKVNQQARTLKGKWDEGRRRLPSAAKVAAAIAERRAAESATATGRSAGGEATRTTRRSTPAVKVIRARRYEVKPLSLDAATTEVQAGDATFLVFRNEDTDTVHVIYRRPDGHLGLIDAE